MEARPAPSAERAAATLDPPPLPYGRQTIDDDDVAAVAAALRDEFLTTGPRVAEFERQLAARVGAAHAVAVSSGTAALQAALFALEVGRGDEVIVPPLTFIATASTVMMQGGVPVFVDVDPATLLIDPGAVEAAITPRTRAIVAVDYAGQPCDYAALRDIADRRNVGLVADACHALGARCHGRPVGSLADLTAFSFHPVKHITTGEGGAIATNDAALVERMRMFRNHGICSDFRERERRGTWKYESVELGYNYRLTDIQCALGLSQLRKLGAFLARRRAIAAAYDAAFADCRAVRPLGVRPEVTHAYHLYVVRIDARVAAVSRDEAFARLRAAGIGVNVHYLPAHLHRLCRERLGTRPGLCPVAESAYGELLSLPIFPAMTDGDVARVSDAVRDVCERGRG